MKKLTIKDRKLRLKIQKTEKKQFILKSIFKNLNLFILIRWNAFLMLNNLSKLNSKTSISNRCLYTINKKRLNKSTTFSRHELLKWLRFGQIVGIRKSSW